MVNREGCVVRAAEFCHFYSWDFPSKTAAFCLFLPAVAAATRWMYLYIPDFLFYFFRKTTGRLGPRSFRSANHFTHGETKKK
jgi:hypothetical protein